MPDSWNERYGRDRGRDRWLQRDDVHHRVKLAVVFFVLLAGHMVLGVACVHFLSLVSDIPAAGRGPVYIWVFVFGLALAGAGTYAVHRALSDG